MAEQPESSPLEHADGGLAVEVTGTGDGGVVVTPVGDLDVVTAPALTERLDAMFAAGPARVVVDLSRTVFFGSTGIAAMLNASDHAHRVGVVLRIVVDDQPMVTRALATAGVLDLLPTCHTLHEALSS